MYDLSFSVQIQFTGRYDQSTVLDLHFYYAGNAEISFIWKVINEFVSEKLVQLTNSKDAISVSCHTTCWFGWFQHRIYRMLLYATCNLTVSVA